MTTETKMSADEVLAVIARHRDTHESLGVVDAYSAQEYPRLRDAHAAVAALIAERDALRASLDEILNYSGGADSALSDEYVVGRALSALARAEAGHG